MTLHVRRLPLSAAVHSRVIVRACPNGGSVKIVKKDRQRWEIGRRFFFTLPLARVPCRTVTGLRAIGIRIVDQRHILSTSGVEYLEVLYWVECWF